MQNINGDVALLPQLGQYSCCQYKASDLQVDAGEEGAWGGRAKHIACIAIHALIEVGLEAVEQVLNACVDLQRVVLV